MVRTQKGDATIPVTDSKVIIAHICNNVNAWGRGFVVPLGKAYPKAKAAFHMAGQKFGQEELLGKIQIVRITDIALLDKATREMRRRTDNKFFKFDEEDRVISFDHRKYIKETTVGKLRPFGKKYGIKGYSRMGHWALYSAIMNLSKEDIGDIVYELIANDKAYPDYWNI